MMEKNAKIYVAGHRGMVGSAIVRELNRQGCNLPLDALEPEECAQALYNLVKA